MLYFQCYSVIRFYTVASWLILRTPRGFTLLEKTVHCTPFQQFVAVYPLPSVKRRWEAGGESLRATYVRGIIA